LTYCLSNNEFLYLMNSLEDEGRQVGFLGGGYGVGVSSKYLDSVLAGLYIDVPPGDSEMAGLLAHMSTKKPKRLRRVAP
jgi:hypothetical protein